jgi:hypothetical protein
VPDIGERDVFPAVYRPAMQKKSKDRLMESIYSGAAFG